MVGKSSIRPNQTSGRASWKAVKLVGKARKTMDSAFDNVVWTVGLARV